MSRLDSLTEDYYDAKKYIYGLAHSVCVNGKEQTVLIQTLHTIESDAVKDGCNGEEIIKRLLYPIMDGLQYGNWPWTKVD